MNYSIKKVAGEIDWSLIPEVPMKETYENTPEYMETHAQICYSDDALHVHMWTVNDDIRAEEKGDLGMPCMDSCLEFFFAPVEDDKRYINIEYNSVKCMYLGFGTGMPDNTRLVPQEGAEIFTPTVNFTETGWEIFYSVKYSFIRRFFPNFEAKPGGTMKANFYKCSEGTEPGNFFSWSRVVKDRPSYFHNYSCFGTLTFAE